MSSSFLTTDVLIAGSGHAGGMLALTLRQAGYRGSITMVGEEPHPPYERPELSKSWLTANLNPARLLLRPTTYWESNTISWIGNRAVERIRPAQRQADLCSGRTYCYQWLVLATGGRARLLPITGNRLAGVHSLRTLEDAEQLKAALPNPPARAEKPIAIIGGGYIGLEVAASLRQLGHSVHVVEAQNQLLARVATPPMAAAFRHLHTHNGVVLHTGVQAVRFLGTNQVDGVALSDGQVLQACMVIVGIGLVPNQELGARAGLVCSDGICVDAYCRTSDPHILAIGDVACFPSPATGSFMRLESVQNAVDQARIAAQVILGTPKPYQEIPWFWSVHYGIKFQAAGLNLGYDDLVVRGDPMEPPFSVLALRDGRVISVEALGSIKDFMGGKLLIASRARPDKNALGDPAQSLKALAPHTA
jgi:3-phenylpropionate/trans-cinnamate dioxygenase ferredoxin reductase subunit